MKTFNCGSRATCFIAVRSSSRPPSRSASQTASARQRSGDADAVAANQATVQKYCVSCHNDKVKSGGLALTTLDLARAPKDAEAWEHVIRKVRTGAMPPAGRPRPDKAAATGLVTYLETELDKAALANPNPGRLALPRLNRAEYRNAIRDLLGARDRRRVDAAERRRRLRIRQQRRRADALADADRALSRSGGENQSDGARAAARGSDAGNLLRADRSQSERAHQRRSASRISRRRRDALLLSCRRRVPVRDAAQRERRRRRVRGHYGRAASARHRHR